MPKTHRRKSVSKKRTHSHIRSRTRSHIRSRTRSHIRSRTRSHIRSRTRQRKFTYKKGKGGNWFGRQRSKSEGECSVREQSEVMNKFQEIMKCATPQQIRIMKDIINVKDDEQTIADKARQSIKSDKPMFQFK